jgi:hypothetical protein
MILLEELDLARAQTLQPIPLSYWTKQIKEKNPDTIHWNINATALNATKRIKVTL